MFSSAYYREAVFKFGENVYIFDNTVTEETSASHTFKLRISNSTHTQQSPAFF